MEKKDVKPPVETPKGKRAIKGTAEPDIKK